MRSALRHTPGFSLIELSIVIAILSVVVTFGLQAAATYLNRSAVDLTRGRLVIIDQAIADFFKIYGRLPCPALRNITAGATASPVDPGYGLENCAIAVFAGADPPGGGVMSGAVPFRALNLPMSMSLDGFYSKINYAVTKNLTVAGATTGRFGFYDGTSAATLATSGVGGIEIRSGILAQACAAPNCQIVANPTPASFPATALAGTYPTGAAYIVFSSGPDKRGAVSQLGMTLTSCASSAGGDTRVDTQNCVQGDNAVRLLMTPTNIPYNVFYDNRYNAGYNLRNYFDDLVIWRTKGQL